MIAHVDIFEMEDEDEIPEKYFWIERLLDSAKWNVLVNVFTVYALFSDDIRVLMFRK
jgi:hypothetical protein